MTSHKLHRLPCSLKARDHAARYPCHRLQVSCQQKDFTYDHVYGGGAQDAGKLYNQCVLPLVGGLFKGYNATVFAYGASSSRSIEGHARPLMCHQL